jgi:prolyl oligopeptidase
LFTKFTEIVYYRSKNSKLPDAVPGPGGDVFFDVRSNLLPNLYASDLFQPNVLSSDGSVSLSTASFSRNGKWFAYALSRSVRYFVAVTVQSNIVSVGKRLHEHLHSLH